MAFEHILLTLPGREANADLSNYQHRWVKGSDATAGKVAAIGSADDTAIGILQNAPAAAGRAASVAVMGISKVAAATSVGWLDGCAVGWTTVGVTGGAVPRATSVAGSMKSGARYIKNEASVAQGQMISVVLLGGALSATN
jgi:hypothetical protein